MNRLIRGFKRKAHRMDRNGAIKAMKYGNPARNCERHIYKLMLRTEACPYCGEKLEWHNMSLDHIHPISKGGGHVPGNLRIMCVECNLFKADAIEMPVK